jgi:hypothetical protein
MGFFLLFIAAIFAVVPFITFWGTSHAPLEHRTNLLLSVILAMLVVIAGISYGIALEEHDQTVLLEQIANQP